MNLFCLFQLNLCCKHHDTPRTLLWNSQGPWTCGSDIGWKLFHFHQLCGLYHRCHAAIESFQLDWKGRSLQVRNEPKESIHYDTIKTVLFPASRRRSHQASSKPIFAMEQSQRPKWVGICNYIEPQYSSYHIHLSTAPLLSSIASSRHLDFCRHGKFLLTSYLGGNNLY